MTIADYELMSYNTQEIKRYINQLGEVIVYYRNVTINDEDAAAVEIKVEKTMATSRMKDTMTVWQRADIAAQLVSHCVYGS